MKRIVHLILALGTVGLVALAILLALTASVQPLVHAAGNVIKVPDDYPTIQAAIDAATDGDTILVAEGLYKENLSLTEGITLSGGWDLTFSTRQPGNSAINGQGLGRAISITCVTSDTVLTIDGFTVQGGNATGLGGTPEMLSAAAEIPGYGMELAPDPLTPAEHVARLRADLVGVVERGLYPGGSAAYRSMLDRVQQQIARVEQAGAQPQATKNPSQQGADCGGGIYSWNASLHLLNSTLLGNVASLGGDGCGGGVFVGQSPPAGVLIRGNTLRQNIASAAPTALGHGGGVYAVQTPGLVVAGNLFQENAAMSAGLVSVGEGGGLFVEASPDVVVRDNQFVRNSANGGWESYGGLGGGAILRFADGATVAHNEFRENLGFVHAQGGGGGLAVVKSAQVAVVNNEVTGNWGGMFQRDRAGAEGGGIALWQTDDIIVMDNVISNNTAAVSGALSGAIFGGGLEGEMWRQGRVERNVFSGNVASQTGIGRGGGASLWGTNDVWVTGNAFTGNAASLSERSGAGGGLFLLNTHDSRLEENVFQDNLAVASGEGHGGGLCVWSEPQNSDTTVVANLFLDNRAVAELGGPNPSDGGACYFDSFGLAFTNNVVAGNSADLGGGLYLSFAQGGVVTNNTLAGNSDAAILVDQYNLTPITFTNNIVVSHTVGISVAQGAAARVSYSLWHGNGADIGGAGVITHTHPVMGSPAFVDPAGDDYRLTLASAARDAGDPAGVPPAPKHDANGVPRPQGPAVDIGAYEWRGHWWYLPLVLKSWRADIGWAVGDSADGYGTILHTTDGGRTWTRQGTAAEIPNTQLKEVSAVDDQNAWVVGANAILRTRNGGQTWEQQTLPSGLPTGFELQGIKALDANTVYVVGTPSILLQTTNGATWSQMSRGTDVLGNITFQVVDAVDTGHVWTVGATMIGGNRTDPVIAFYNGLEWHLQPTSVLTSPTTAVIGISAIDPLHAWAVGGWGMPLATTADGGATWQVTAHPLSAGDMNRVAAVSPTTGWVAGDYGNVRYTTNAGATWYDVSVPSAFLFGITAMDDKMAWVVGPGLHGTPPGIIARTCDAQHWEVQSDPSWPNMNGISFVGARR